MRLKFISNVIMSGSVVVDQSMAFCWSWSVRPVAIMWFCRIFLRIFGNAFVLRRRVYRGQYHHCRKNSGSLFNAYPVLRSVHDVHAGCQHLRKYKPSVAWKQPFIRT